MAHDITMQSEVVMHYRISLTDGTEVESSFDEDPVEIYMGRHELPEGMELAIYGLREGDTQTLTLTPEQCFGERDENNITTMARSEFPAGLAPEIGLSYAFGTDTGEEVTGTVRSIHGDDVEVDFNHPLAGHHLVFSVEILEVNNDHEPVSYED